MRVKRINVMIADDEYLVREHLKRAVNWEQLGFKVVHEVENGQQAVDYMESGSESVDVVIMDICMPILDGIGATKVIKESGKNCYIVILTGHDDFEYARQSIKLGVTDYLSKPINRKEVVRTLESIIDTEKLKLKADEELVIETLEKVRVQSEEPKKYSEKVMSLLALIHDELGNKEFSLNKASEVLYTNVSYLSRRFKEEIGINFNKYLLECRMEKAIRLIKETSMKNYEIAEAVGIEDPNYFSYSFKRYMKISITDYRKTLSSK